MKQRIRIISGSFRGKALNFPDIQDLRPTPDRVRETVFNWLMHDVRHARCLDAFAGSGALGFEAFSRGASSVVFLEANRDAYNSLEKTKQSLAPQQPNKLTGLSILNINAERYFDSTQEQFDIVFLDPPFANPELLRRCIERLETKPMLLPNGLLYLETPEPHCLDTKYWETLKAKQAGQVHYGLHRKRGVVENQ